MRGGCIRKLRLFWKLAVFNCCYFVFCIFQNRISIEDFFNCAWKKNLANFNIFVYFHFNLPSWMFIFFFCKTDIFSCCSLLWRWIGTQEKTSRNILTRVYSSYFFRRLYLGETSAGLVDIDFWKFSLCFCFHLYLKWFTTHLFIINISYRHWQSSPRATKLPQN